MTKLNILVMVGYSMTIPSFPSYKCTGERGGEREHLGL